jgi:hypothetical protein
MLSSKGFNRWFAENERCDAKNDIAKFGFDLIANR